MPSPARLRMYVESKFDPACDLQENGSTYAKEAVPCGTPVIFVGCIVKNGLEGGALARNACRIARTEGQDHIVIHKCLIGIIDRSPSHIIYATAERESGNALQAVLAEQAGGTLRRVIGYLAESLGIGL